MRNRINILLIVTAMIMFIGCGSGDASFQGQNEEIEVMIGEEIVVNSGDKLITQEDTTIRVIHEVDSTYKRVTLLSGTATLIRGDYVVN